MAFKVTVKNKTTKEEIYTEVPTKEKAEWVKGYLEEDKNIKVSYKKTK
jgi:hypothetical protein